jgi:hypothetical protein
LVCWRGIWSSEARIIRIDKRTEPSFEKDKANGADKKHGRSGDSWVGSKKDRNTNRKKKSSFRKTNNKKGRRVKVMRQTHTEKTGIIETSVTISMKDSDNSIGGDGNIDDNSTSGQDEESTKKETPARKKEKNRRKLVETQSPNVDHTQGSKNQGQSSTQGLKLVSSAVLDGIRFFWRLTTKPSN